MSVHSLGPYPNLRSSSPSPHRKIGPRFLTNSPNFYQNMNRSVSPAVENSQNKSRPSSQIREEENSKKKERASRPAVRPKVYNSRLQQINYDRSPNDEEVNFDNLPRRRSSVGVGIESAEAESSVSLRRSSSSSNIEQNSIERNDRTNNTKKNSENDQIIEREIITGTNSHRRSSYAGLERSRRRSSVTIDPDAKYMDEYDNSGCKPSVVSGRPPLASCSSHQKALIRTHSQTTLVKVNSCNAFKPILDHEQTGNRGEIS